MTYTGTVLLLSPLGKSNQIATASDRESLVNGQMGNNQYE